MTISEYKDTVRGSVSLPVNFHIDIEGLSTYEKWVSQFNTTINVESGTEKQVSYAINIKKTLV